MAVKLQNHSFLPHSFSGPCLSRNSRVSCNGVAHLGYLLRNWGNSRKKCLSRLAFCGNGGFSCQLVVRKSVFLSDWRMRRLGTCFPLASADDGVTVNGSPQASTSSRVEEMRAKLNQSLQGDDPGDRLVQSLHDAARVFELAIRERGFLLKLSWFSTAWLGIDRNAWVKTLSYQASVYCLLQAATEIASRGDGREWDINIFVQRSLLRQTAPLDSLIREKLSAKLPDNYEWFWSEQVPAVVAFFVDYFEDDPRFTAATDFMKRGKLLGSGSGSDTTLLLLSLACVAGITKLGPTKVSCPEFFTVITDVTGRLMDMLVDLIPLSQAYYSIKSIGLRREFLVHFGPRASKCRVKDDSSSEEVIFWVNLVQKQLQQAIDRERMWSRLTTTESIEVLEKDLAIFGFFIALGRSSKSFLSANGFDGFDDPIEGYLRFLIGGSILYYPQLSSISSYQLYVEVVCEELDWLPFFPGSSKDNIAMQSHGHQNKREGPPNVEAISILVDVCSHWMQSFIKYSKWLESPSNIKAARFLSRGHGKLMECMEELGISRSLIENYGNGSAYKTRSESVLQADRGTDSFDKALEGVEEALLRLENLLQELHVARSNSGKEHLKAACSDLEKIRKLKKEAEFLEASFSAKAALLQQGDAENNRPTSPSERQQLFKRKRGKNGQAKVDGSNSNFRGLLNFFVPSRMKPDSDLSAADVLEDGCVVQTTSNKGDTDSEPNEIHRFEVLRNELMELEKRVQRSTDLYQNEEDIKVTNDYTNNNNDGSAQLVQVQKKENFIGKSLDKLKETSTDILQGTQLLAVDVAAAMGFLRRTLIGDELTEKEKKAFRRTLTDLASVVPIGVLMLLPVTAVGHAAILAAIQRYVPSLIPSTYGPERLDLLRQLEKMKELETCELDSNSNEELD